jgi:hypothetical protein
MGRSNRCLPGRDRLRAFAAAGNDRFAAVGESIRRASQADLARLHAPWDPVAGRYLTPDENTIPVMLDRLDPANSGPALLGAAVPDGTGAIPRVADA